MKKILGILSLALLFNISANAGGLRHYDISITNATAHHVLTPVLIATHDDGIHLFKIGDIASPGLALQAETGDNSVILAETQFRDGVFDTVAGTTPILGGMTASYLITAPKGAHLSFTAMLATTNDAFAALNSVMLPKKSVTYYAHVYDAGSEENNELCDFIPGPPCGDEFNDRAPDGSEGFISISSGIHGNGELSAQDLDWNNPGAIVTITRIDDDDDDDDDDD